MRELRRMVNKDNALFDELAEAWPNLTDSQKANLVKVAKVAVATNEAADAA